MTDARPPFSRSDVVPTIGLFLFGILLSFGLFSATLFLFHGLWILWPVLLFLLVFQLIFEGGVRLIWWGLRRGWRALRGLLPPPPQATPPRAPEPWLKSYALLIGLIIGGTWMLLASWRTGDLQLNGGTP